MMKFGKNVAAGVTTIFLLVALSACQKQEGPAEQAGKSLDKAVEKVGEKIQDAAKGDKK